MPEWRKIFEAEAGWQRQGIKAAVRLQRENARDTFVDI